MSSLIVRLQTMQNTQARTKEQSTDLGSGFGSTRHGLACGSVRFGEVWFVSIVWRQAASQDWKKFKHPLKGIWQGSYIRCTVIDIIHVLIDNDTSIACYRELPIVRYIDTSNESNDNVGEFADIDYGSLLGRIAVIGGMLSTTVYKIYSISLTEQKISLVYSW